MSLPVYRVTLEVPGGTAVLDVPTYQGQQVAANRAFYSAVHVGWGDLDEVRVVRVEPLPAEALSG